MFVTFKGLLLLLFIYTCIFLFTLLLLLLLLFLDPYKYHLRTYIYQARDLYASDKSGLSGTSVSNQFHTL